MPGYFAKTNSK